MGIFADYSIGPKGPQGVAESSWFIDNDGLMKVKEGRLATAMALALAGAFLLAACSDAPASPAGHRESSAVLPKSPVAIPMFTPLEFKQLLSRLQGKPVVVNIWASWCGPCTEEAPGLAAEARHFQGQAQFLGVDIADQLPQARAFIRKYGWPYPSVFDPTGAIRNDLGFIGQPVTVIYDASGKQAFTFSGPIPDKVLREELEDLL